MLKLKKTIDGKGFQTTDGSELRWSSYELYKFGKRGDNHFMVPCQNSDDTPTHVLANDTQRHNAASDFTCWLELEHLQFVRAVQGTIRKRADSTREGGVDCKSYKYSVYVCYERHSHPNIVIGEVHGGGASFYLVDNLFFDETFKSTLFNFTDNALFDLLSVFCRAFNTGRNAGHSEASKIYVEAFVEGRLRKRKMRSNGMYKVSVLSKVEKLG